MVRQIRKIPATMSGPTILPQYEQAWLSSSLLGAFDELFLLADDAVLPLLAATGIAGRSGDVSFFRTEGVEDLLGTESPAAL